MKKIIVIGCPGSGKSVFSKKLNKATGIPLYHLDLLYWNKDKTTVLREVFLDRLNDILNKESWIIDGNYANSMELRFEKCDTVFFLDYPSEICIKGIEERMGKSRSDMPWIETEKDEEFISYVENFVNEGRNKITKLINKYPEKNIIIFKAREEAEKYLENIIM